jgi:hypothetical protein
MYITLLTICFLFGHLRLSPIKLVIAAAADVDVAPSSPSSPQHSHKSLGQLSKFETYGPTITVILRDPTLSSRSNRPLIAKSKSLVSNDIPMSFESLAAKLAARFRIASETSASMERSQTPTQFANGYMVDSGKIMLGPPSQSRHDQSAMQLFPALGGSGSMTSWSDCIINIQPELTYKVRSRVHNNNAEDMRPFPHSLPWVNAVSCGLKWRPFPTYNPGEGYGHKLMSVPHYVQCGTSICLPRVLGIGKRSVNIDVTYHDDSTRKGGRVELLLGKSSPYLHPQREDQNTSRRNNHILTCLSTGKNGGRPAFEYIRGSLYLPLPSFLHKSSKGVSVSPSFDFVDNRARLVVSGDVGTRGRTSAVLRLDSDDSTLTVVRALDERQGVHFVFSLL